MVLRQHAIKSLSALNPGRTTKRQNRGQRLRLPIAATAIVGDTTEYPPCYGWATDRHAVNFPSTHNSRTHIALYGNWPYIFRMSTTSNKRRQTPTARSEPIRSARLEARVSESQKALIERAAAYEGRSVTDFVVSTLAAAADSVVREHELVRLTQVQSQAFVEALLHPKAPNPALRRAARQHQQSVESR